MPLACHRDAGSPGSVLLGAADMFSQWGPGTGRLQKHRGDERRELAKLGRIRDAG